MTKEEIKELVKNRLTSERLHAFLLALKNDGFFEIQDTPAPETDVDNYTYVGICTAQEISEDAEDLGVALANLLGSDA